MVIDFVTLLPIFMFLALAILLSLFNYGNPSIVSNIHGQYLIEATKLYEGGEPRYTRGPVYPYLLTLSFALGEDHFSLAHWLTQGVYFLTIVIVFIFIISMKTHLKQRKMLKSRTKGSLPVSGPPTPTSNS